MKEKCTLPIDIIILSGSFRLVKRFCDHRWLISRFGRFMIFERPRRLERFEAGSHRKVGAARARGEPGWPREALLLYDV